jgi:hypothetical protein
MSASERKIAQLEMERDGAIAMCDAHAKMLFEACESLLADGIELNPRQAAFYKDFQAFADQVEHGMIIKPSLNGG